MVPSKREISRETLNTNFTFETRELLQRCIAYIIIYIRWQLAFQLVSIGLKFDFQSLPQILKGRLH